MAPCFHPSPCQCPAMMGETDDGAQGFNSQITGVRQRNLLPAGTPSTLLPTGDMSPNSPEGDTPHVLHP